MYKVAEVIISVIITLFMGIYAVFSFLVSDILNKIRRK